MKNSSWLVVVLFALFFASGIVWLVKNIVWQQRLTTRGGRELATVEQVEAELQRIGSSPLAIHIFHEGGELATCIFMIEKRDSGAAGMEFSILPAGDGSTLAIQSLAETHSLTSRTQDAYVWFQFFGSIEEVRRIFHDFIDKIHVTYGEHRVTIELQREADDDETEYWYKM